ncbi:UNKNOWN [Stylonychia lemnae]|uniref:VPS9 domain-containing protein n=1 Tax=Stylonychia lemnae TaxID=5949 RepID=A0A078AVM3_STYLE|nr:UNKNOWN [Stylonychia lemnae]|eukprot:CDW86425.1 UNKNOWN [Stylonychia lemnae]
MEKNPSFRSVARSDESSSMYRDKSNTVLTQKKDIEKTIQEQSKFYIESQFTLLNSTTNNETSNSPDKRRSMPDESRSSILEENFASQSGGCCLWNIFQRGPRQSMKGKSTIERLNSNQSVRKAQKQKVLPISVTITRQQDKQDVWSVYLLNNLKNLEGLVWADSLMNYMTINENEFLDTKYRSNIYFLNYTKSQMVQTSVQQRQVMMQRKLTETFTREQLDSLKQSFQKHMGIANQSDQTLISNQTTLRDQNQSQNDIEYGNIAASKKGLARQSLETNTRGHRRLISSDTVPDLYENGLADLQTLKNDENKHRFIYDIEDPNNQSDTIEQMDKQTKLLFEVLRSQLFDNKHPLNIIIRRFSFYFVKHYSQQIVYDEKSNDYYILKSLPTGKYDLQFVNEHQRAHIAQNYMDQPDDQNIYFEDMQNEGEKINREQADYLEFNQFQRADHTINSSMRQSFKRGSFAKQMNQFKKEKEVKYKTAQGALAEVKQFLSLMYGICIRFYVTVIKLDILEKMKEDLVETLTRILFCEQMTNLMIAVCRVTTKDEESSLKYKINELQRVKTSHLGLSQFHCLDKHSKIMEVYLKQYNELCISLNKPVIGPDGDVGGSSNSNDEKEFDFEELKDESMIQSMPSVSASKQHSTFRDNFMSTVDNPIMEENEDSDEDDYQIKDLDEEELQKHRERIATVRIHPKKDSRVSVISRPSGAGEPLIQIEPDMFEQSSEDEEEELIGDLGRFSFQERKTIKLDRMVRLKEEIDMRLKQKPYINAVQQIKMIPEYYTPIDKLRCLATVSHSIIESINKFWKGLDVEKDKLTVNGDSILMIYIFITVKARTNVQDLFAHVKYMGEFSTPFVRNTKLGYCLTTLEIALNHILNLTKDDFETKDDCDMFSESSSIWSEKRRTLTRSLRESLSASVRSNSLVIKDDPLGDYFKFEELHRPQ